MSKVFGTALSLLMVLMMMSFLGCEGDQGPQGPQGAQGEDGTNGRDASTDPPGDMVFGLAIGNNSNYDLNGTGKITLTFDQSAEPSEDVVVCYKLDKPPVLDGQDKGIEDWGSDEFSISSVPLDNLRGEDNLTTFADIRAGYDDKYIYFLVSWQENVGGTQNFYPGRWRCTIDANRDTSWAREPMTEDELLLFWDISGIDGWTDNGSSMLFHDQDSALYLTGTGLVDVWHYKAGRTGVIGYFDDEYITSEIPGLQFDQGSAAYVDNVNEDLPKWMRRGDPRSDPNSVDNKPPFELWDTAPFGVGLRWPNNSTILGFVSVIPTGSRSDIECSGTQSWVQGESRWYLEFRRLRHTGNGDDVKF